MTVSSQTPHSALYQLHISPDLPWFDGHFPNQPVLPGVTQTHWACLLSRDVFSIQDEFKGIKNLKFNSPIVPDRQISLQLDYQREKNQVRFAYSDNQTALSSGTLEFSAADARS